MRKLIARLEKLLAAIALVFVAAAGAAAQSRPDFSGRWTAVTPPPVAPGTPAGDPAALPNTMGSGWGSALTIEQTPAALVVERAQFVQYDMQPPMRMTYTLDGSDSRNTVNMGRGAQEFVSKTAWQDAALMITTTVRFTHPGTGAPGAAELKQTLSLDASGALIVTTMLAGVAGGPATTTTTTYTKGS